MNTLPRKIIAFLVINLALGLMLLAFMTWVETMGVPAWAEGATRVIYNPAFGFSLPLLSMVQIYKADGGHHLQLPYRVLAYLFTPFLCTTFLLLIYIARSRRRRARAERTGEPISRRRFFIETSDAVLLGGATAMGGYCTWYVPRDLTVRRYDMPIKGLPAAMDGYTIAQISDTHYGPFVSMAHIRNAIQLTNSLNPDFTVLTGDYVLSTPRAIEHGVGIMQEVKARHGVAAVLGNHDHWEGADAVRQAFAALNIPMLDNARMFISSAGISADAKPGGEICLGGVGDLWEDVASVRYALRKVDPDVPRILLSHNPDVAEDQSHHERVDLMLSGHTHGGQISVPFRGTIMIPSAYGNKYAGGVCAGPRHPVIVSRGVGLAVMPYRFRVPPEIVHITLRQTRA